MSCTGRSSHGLADADLLGEAMSETVQLLQHVRRYIEAEPPSSRPKEATLEVLDRAIASLASCAAPSGLEVYEADRSAREACMEIVAQHQCGECDASQKIIDAIRRTITPSDRAPAAGDKENK